MNNLREIKKSRLLEDESFTYMISSDERTNSIGADAGNLTNFYDIKFGGFSYPYDNYKVEVLNTKIVYLGSQQSLNNKFSTLAFYNSTGTDYEYQHSAFTEDLKNKLLTYTQTQQIFPDFTQFENPIKIINGKLGKFNLKKPLRFYIESDLEE